MFCFINEKKNQKGFTLIELMIIVIVVGVLAAAAVPLYLGYRDDARRAEAKGALAAVITSMNYYYQNAGRYPTSAVFASQVLPRASLDEMVVQNWNAPTLLAGGNSSGPTGFFIIKMQAQTWKNRDGQSMYYVLVYDRSNSQKTWLDETGMTQVEG